MTIQSEFNLMQMHVETLYTHNKDSYIESINQWNGGIAPRFFLGRTKTGNLWRFRKDLPNDLINSLKKLCQNESVKENISPTPFYQDEYTRLLLNHREIKKVWTGPAYCFSQNILPEVSSVKINEANVSLLHNGFEDWLPDVPYQQPFMAMIEDGRAVSICASVRITNDAHEAGVETLPAYRRKGYATKVVLAWANEVRKQGVVPLYSTSWSNVASQNVAARLGLFKFGIDFHIT